MSQKINMNHPFTCLVGGPTKSGKTVFVKTLIEKKERMINQQIDRVIWYYTENQPLYETLKNKVEFIEGIPDLSSLKSNTKTPTIVVLDDLMYETKGNSTLLKLFTRGCHHWNLSVIQIVQNVFFDGLRTCRINSDYLVMFKNPSDRLQARILGRQLFPNNYKYFMESYLDATSAPHGYLFIDLTQYTPEEYRLKTNIFSPTPTLYIN